MHEQIYVNLPVADLTASSAFWKALGYQFNPEFSDDKAACLILGPNLYAMLLSTPFFSGFTAKPVVDAKTATEVLVCLSCDSREELDRLVAQAVAAGGSAPRPLVDHGFMVQHGFEDLDGHIWELVFAPKPAGT
jgi:predicted lactoylglutathione lyase